MRNVWKIGLMTLAAVLLVSPLLGAQTLGEPPLLEDLVAEGELPPMEDRLPADVLVVDTPHEIGQYGGTLNTATLSLLGWGDHVAGFNFMGAMVKPAPGADGVVPSVAKELEYDEDMTVFTFHLREGMRWSDGEPYTTEDVLFWYEDVLFNEELTPTIPAHLRDEGEVAELEVIDDYTFKLSFVSPQPFFPEILAFQGWWFVVPSHYVKQFHVDYADPDELQEMMDEHGFDAWYDLYDYKNEQIAQVPLHPDRPSLTAYHLAEITSDRLVLERNPYFWKVDSEGNQLPYIDRIIGNLVSDLEVAQGQILSGEIDFATRNVDIRNYPMYRQYEEEGGYRTLLWDQALGSEVIYQFNLTHEDPVMREIFQDKRFRQAMSLAMDRDEINDVVYYGQGLPRQFTVLPTSSYFQDEFGSAYADYDPERAGELLDEMGLDEMDSAGFRLRPDGDRLTFTIEYTSRPYPVLPNIELVTEFWRDVGIDARFQEISGELQTQRATGNMMDATIWGGDAVTDLMFPHNNHFLMPTLPSWGNTIWPLWSDWVATDGEDGEEPPEDIKHLIDLRARVLREPDADERHAIITEILEIQAENLWAIGTVGLSPRPIIANKNLGNVPEENLWAWDTYTGCHVHLETMFFQE